MHSNSFTALKGAKNNPSFGFLEDPLTGLYLVSAGVIGIVANGVEVGRLSANGGLSISSGAGLGGTVAQATSPATGVTLNKIAGSITTQAWTAAAAAEHVFTLTNSMIAANDVVVVSTVYSGAGTPQVTLSNQVTGAIDIVISNCHASAALNAAATINFMVLKSATT